MTRRERQRQILACLDTLPELSLMDACERFRASSATIRRDFVQLSESGQVARIWGGIQLASRGALQLAPPAFNERLGTHTAEKRLIARAAAQLLCDGDVVMIDGGTTTFQLAEFISHKRITVITNSLMMAHAIDRLKAGKLGAEVYLTGGLLEPQSGVVVGPLAEESLRRYRAKWVFLSAAGIDTETVTNYNEAVLGSEHLMIAQSEQVVLLAPREPLEQVD
jgi:DeoR/GlpR family transcriptional regulator of sugar metabolism